MFKVARVLFGSDNYGLNGPDSDKDYKVLFCPSFYDLYYSHKLEKSSLRDYDSDHNVPIDCRQFNSLFLKGTVNIVEMVYSIEWEFFDDTFKSYINRAQEVLNLGYLATVWDKFYASVQGMALNSLERYGINSKSVSRAYYFLKLTESLATQGFYMSESTWRNNFYCDEARDIRFHPEKYDLESMSNKIMEGFAANKEKFANAAKEWCEERRHGDGSSMSTLFYKVTALDNFMYGYVKNKMEEN